MNIFYLDSDPTLAAQYHHDTHLNKMIIETAQILSTALWIKNCGHAEKLYADGKIYLPTHEHHPCVKWVVENFYNYSWTYGLFEELGCEFKHRTGKDHKTYSTYSEGLLNFLIPEYKKDIGLEGKTTPPKLAMPSEYYDIDPVQAYRNYYNAEKRFDKRGRDMFVWTNRETPYWIEM